MDFQFDSSVSGTMIYRTVINQLNSFTLFTVFHLWNLIGESKQMSLVFKMGLVRKNDFTNYWSTRQSMENPWLRMIFSRDHFRKIARAFHIVDKTIIPTMHDPLYRQNARMRLQLDYMNSLIFICTISLLGQFGSWGKVCIPILDSTF